MNAKYEVPVMELLKIHLHPCYTMLTNSYQSFEWLYCLHSFWTAWPCSWGH